MWVYQKNLEYPVKVSGPNPKLAKVIITQYGGPDGELSASLRYLNQRYTMPTNKAKGLLTDIGSEGSVLPQKCSQSLVPCGRNIVHRSITIYYIT